MKSPHTSASGRVNWTRRSGGVQAHGHARIAGHPVTTSMSSLLVRGLRARVAVWHRDGAAAHDRVHLRDAGQLTVPATRDQRLVVGQGPAAASSGWMTTSAASPRNSSCEFSAGLPPRHQAERRGFP